LLPVGSNVVLDVIQKGTAKQVTACLAEAVPEKLEVPTKMIAPLRLIRCNPKTGRHEHRALIGMDTDRSILSGDENGHR
jgi:hypothetical protein